MRHYSKKMDFSLNNSKGKIIVCFDGLFSHGGLVDRLKGIISFYEIAKILGYDFYIYFDHPFQLFRFLKPNKLNWMINEKEIKYNPLHTRILYLMNNFEINPLELIKNSKYKTFIIYTNLNYLGTIHKENSETENQQLWHKNYNELFGVSEEFKIEFQKLPEDSRIVIHTRFTSLMGDFEDTSNIILDQNKKQGLINDLILKINEIAILHPNKKIYVLSDSIVFLNYIKKNTHFYVLKGNPKHIDINTNNADLESNYKAFLDFYFMSKSDEVYLLRLNSMYNSGFSKYAAIVGDIKFTVVT